MARNGTGQKGGAKGELGRRLDSAEQGLTKAAQSVGEALAAALETVREQGRRGLAAAEPLRVAMTRKTKKARKTKKTKKTKKARKTKKATKARKTKKATKARKATKAGKGRKAKKATRSRKAPAKGRRTRKWT